MKNTITEFLLCTFVVFVIVLALSFLTHRGTFEWTLDGSHHVLKIGNVK